MSNFEFAVPTLVGLERIAGDDNLKHLLQQK